MAGQRYWLGATGGPDAFGEWSLNLFQGDPSDGGASQVVMNGVAQPWSVGSGSRTGALVVEGIVIPEPSFAALIAGVVIAFVLVQAIKGNQSRAPFQHE
jgi:hypothetical protein